MSETGGTFEHSPFGLQPHETVDIVIDGQKLYSMSRSMQRDIDYKMLRAHFRSHCDLRRAHYYTTLVEYEEGVHNPVKPLVDWLGFNGYHTMVKEVREVVDPETQRRSVVGSMTVELTVDMIDFAEHTDHIVLFTNNGDLTYAVEKLIARGVKVTVVGLLSPLNKAYCAPSLRRAVEGRFVDLASVIDLMSKPVRLDARPQGYEG